ncbi:MAG: beta-galactosidase GalA [Rudaea sp.]
MPELTRRALLQALLAAGGGAATRGTAAFDAEPTSVSRTDATRAARVAAGQRERQRFDSDWRFHLGHAQDPARDFGFGADQRTFAKAGANTAAAAQLAFDDAAWESVDLPHDWVVALPFVSATPVPRTKEDVAAAHGYKPIGRNYPDTSVGWYRRVFEVAASDLGKRIVLQFDGVFRDCVVFCNGHIVGRNESGYAGFSVEISDVLGYGARNVVAVRVDATLGEGWFYEGAGIYRHAWLLQTAPLHLPQDGTCVRSELRDGAARLQLVSEIRNEGTQARECGVRWIVFAPDGREIARVASTRMKIAAGEHGVATAQVDLAAAALWSIENPQLHRLEAQLLTDAAAPGAAVSGDAVVDAIETRFGVRSFAFDAQRGFLLNGEVVKLKGTCNHQDHAGVGSAIPDRLHEWRIEQLKGMGANAYRSSHNPATPELLDACDRLGMLVIAETRRMSSSAEAMGELERMVRRDRNHACVMLWSLGNEEPEMVTERGARIVSSMKGLVNRIDPSRLCTFAMDRGFGSGVSSVVDVLGFNYRTDGIDEFHRRFPDKPVIGTETASTVATRGVYRRAEARGFVRAYDVDHPWWGSTAEAWWSYVAARPYIAGGFVWTGFDYRGEPTPFNRWPNVASQFGILDSCGFPKDNYWYYRAQWTREPVLHLFPHWNWDGAFAPDESRRVDVWCHTNLDSVELLVNGVSQGEQKVPQYGHVEWSVRYAPGVIEARGFRAGNLVLTQRRETAGPPARIAMRLDRAAIKADAQDLCVVRVAILDANGRIVPTADNEVTFSIAAPGRLIGVGNGNPASHESDKADRRRAFNGLCMAIVQATRRVGSARLEASSPGLEGATAMISIG